MSSFGSICEFILGCLGQRSPEWPARSERVAANTALVVTDLLLVAHDAPIEHSDTAPVGRASDAASVATWATANADHGSRSRESLLPLDGHLCVPRRRRRAICVCLSIRRVA